MTNDNIDEQHLSEFKNFMDRIVSLEEGGKITEAEAWNQIKTEFKKHKQIHKKLRKNNKTVFKMDADKLADGLNKFQDKLSRNKSRNKK